MDTTRPLIGLALCALFFSCSSSDEGEPAASPVPLEIVEYEVVFESVWSADTHPASFPTKPHYSPVFGAMHSSSASVWSAGELATEGVRAVAQFGDGTLIGEEIDALVAQGAACERVFAEGLRKSPAETRFTVRTTAACPLATLITMVGPSPDWFVGVSGLSLLDDSGQWRDQLTVELHPYDAGTDDGAEHDAKDKATDPRAVISAIDGGPLAGGTSALGTLTFTRLQGPCQAVTNPTWGEAARIEGLRTEPYPSNALRRTVRFETPEPATARVLFWAEGDEAAHVSDPSAEGTEHEVTLIGLLPGTKYHLRAISLVGGRAFGSGSESFTTGALPSDVPTFELTESGTGAFDEFYQDVAHRGFVLVNWVHADSEQRETTAFVILDEKARVVWYEFFPIVAPFQLAKFHWTSARTLVVVQDQGTIVEQTLAGDVLTTLDVTEGLPLHHEVFRREDGAYVALTSESQVVDRTSVGGSEAAEVGGDGILVVKPDGTTVWKWTAFDVLDPLVDNAVQPNSNGNLRWLNANSLTVDSDGGYVVSLRLASQIMKIDGQTGEVVWRLGGEGSDFQVEEAATFIRQHHVTVLEDDSGGGDTFRLLMFDNGHSKDRPFSRALELRVDQTAKTATMVWQHVLPEDLFSGGTSGATRLPNGNTLIVSGRSTAVLNVTRDNEVVWAADGIEGVSYRAFPIELEECATVPVPEVP